MSSTVGHLLVAAVVTLVVGVTTGGGWAYFVMGAVLALALWVMLFAGSYATPAKDAGNGRTSTRQYAIASALAVVLGYALNVVLDNPTWWAVGFILAGAVVPAGVAAQRARAADSA